LRHSRGVIPIDKCRTRGIEFNKSKQPGRAGERERQMTIYLVKIRERWDYEIEADSEAEAKEQAVQLRSQGLNVWHNPGDPKVYDLGTKVEVA